MLHIFESSGIHSEIAPTADFLLPSIATSWGCWLSDYTFAFTPYSELIVSVALRPNRWSLLRPL